MSAVLSPNIPADFRSIRDAGLAVIQATRRLLVATSPPGTWVAFVRERSARGWVAEVAGPLEAIIDRHGESLAGRSVRLAAADVLHAFTNLVNFLPAVEEDRAGEPYSITIVAPPGEPSHWRDTWPERPTAAAGRQFDMLVAALGGSYARLFRLSRSLLANIPQAVEGEDSPESPAILSAAVDRNDSRTDGMVERAGDHSPALAPPAGPGPAVVGQTFGTAGRRGKHRGKDGELTRTARNLLTALAAEANGLTGQEAAAAAPTSHDYARQVLPELVADGLVAHDKRGYRVTPAGREAV